MYLQNKKEVKFISGPVQEILVLIASASCEGSGEPAQSRRLARALTVCTYKVDTSRKAQAKI